MDPESLATSNNNAPRKVKFAPKVPSKREQKPVLPKVEKVENEIDDAQAQQLLQRLNEASFKGKTKVERKVGPTQVAFGYGGSSTSIKSFGTPNLVNSNRGSLSKGGDGGGGAEGILQKEYKEPWDYYTNYPVTLPMRRPYSGNPEHLDDEEFGKDSESLQYDENATNPTVDLGLMEDNLEDRMLFLQLPKTMPIIKKSTNAEGHDQDNNTTNSTKGVGSSQKPNNMGALPAGFMGKLLVYKSGAVKLKLGETLYDVSAGLDCVFAQDVVAINIEEKHCCNIGELNQRAVITPDIDCILDSISDL